MGGFSRKYARDSVLSKLSLGTFAVINIGPQNKELVVAQRFVRQVRQHFHRAIVMCFDEFNRNGGETITLQSGEEMFFKKSIIPAIYADYPAAVKCACTGSACPQCFRKRKEFANAIAEGALVLRTPTSVAARKRSLQIMARTQKNSCTKKSHHTGYSSPLRYWMDHTRRRRWIYPPLARMQKRIIYIRMCRKLCYMDSTRVSLPNYAQALCTPQLWKQ